MRRQDSKNTYEWFLKALQSHNSDECLLWPFGTTHFGYGHVWYEGRLVRTHRLAFKLTYGRWPTPCGLHSCDTPACFNPRHIFEGTKADNLRDAAIKGRTNRGERRHSAKLTSDQAIRIREEYVPQSAHNGAPAIGRRYGVGQTTIYRILHRQSWKYV